MIIVVSPEATPADLESIIARIEETGHKAHLSVGTERSIIGVIGPDVPRAAGHVRKHAPRRVRPSRDQALQTRQPRVPPCQHHRRCRQGRSRRRRRARHNGGPLFNRKRGPHRRYRPSRPGGGREHSSRRRLQAAQLAVRFPRPRRGRSPAPRHRLRRDRHARHHRTHERQRHRCRLQVRRHHPDRRTQHAELHPPR